MIPTRARLSYLEVALASLAAAAREAGAEILVVDDAGPTPAARALAERFGARYEPHPQPLGLNAARNTGVERSEGELVVFVDDDIAAHRGWLEALLAAAREHPDVDVFTGPILPRLDARRPRSCSAGHALVTKLDLGGEDAEAPYAWGANMAVRRNALERVGAFDVSLEQGGDEQEWQDRLRAQDPSARVLYVAHAAVDHRRAGADARLRPLAAAAHARGRAARRYDSRRRRAPSLAAELATLARCVAHVLVRACPAGLTMVAHCAGRLREAAGERRGEDRSLRAQAESANGAGSHAPADDFLSGTSGTVAGLDAVARVIADGALDTFELTSTRRLRLALAARRAPPRRRVLALGVERPEHRSLTRKMQAELLRSRHEVELHSSPPGARGKFENLNLLLAEHSPESWDWLLVIDDDVELPHGFLDRFLFLCERFSLVLAQPAHRLDSHAAWAVTRRRAASVVRETSFVEIGPVTAFARSTFSTLLPFPDLRMGWGLDVHWAAIARQRGWRCGVVDALPIRHRAAPAAASYPRAQAMAEARSFLAQRAHLSASEAQRTLATHRRW
ncbi:MAG: hypothetical protein QOI03_1691 [Solirubrobacteraceae bacterium]|nr:hypothetical protein [Solirubrobacteraceae bacterium]